jgi:3-oxoacyl-[acyl-carrier protein] reductase
MDLGITGKVALVLGAGGGLGGAIARELAGEGAKVAVAGRHTESVDATTSEINAAGGIAKSFVWDLADLAGMGRQVAAIEADLGPVDILVNNTGGPPPTPAHGQPVESWTAYFQSMVLPVIALTDRVLPGMKERRWGRIITSASSGVIAPIPNLGLSNSLRSTLVGWSKTLSREVGPYGVTANLILPGRIATDRITYLDEQKAARDDRPVTQVVAESTSAIPLRRYGNPEEYGQVVAFLAGTGASYITGSVIKIDGGLIPSV